MDVSQMIEDINRVINTYGTVIWKDTGSVVMPATTAYDDETTWASAGSVGFSGIIMPLTARANSFEYKYLQEGRLRETDYKVS